MNLFLEKYLKLEIELKLIAMKKKELKGHQIFLSRAHPQFLAKLFFQEVPEIYEGNRNQISC